MFVEIICTCTLNIFKYTVCILNYITEQPTCCSQPRPRVASQQLTVLSVFNNFDSRQKQHANCEILLQCKKFRSYFIKCHFIPFFLVFFCISLMKTFYGRNTLL